MNEKEIAKIERDLVQAKKNMEKGEKEKKKEDKDNDEEEGGNNSNHPVLPFLITTVSVSVDTGKWLADAEC